MSFSRTVLPASFAAATLLLGATGARAAGAQGSSPCAAPAPAAGQMFSGAVIHVLDGERLCVAAGPSPDQWVEVVLADAPKQTKASTAGADPRGVLMAAAFSQVVQCRAGAPVGGVASAVCTVGGRPLAAVMREPAVLKAAMSWR